MLLFIGCGCALYCCWAWFQYISCYCLSPGNELPNSMWFISIHLMLLFIPSSKPLFPAVQSFQYISCYCLSKMGDEQEDSQHNFNTSHVTVYLSPPCIQFMLCIFQYISCYCLSVALSQAMIDAIKFQYISCYCLSPENASSIELEYQFQYISCYCLSLHCYL